MQIVWSHHRVAVRYPLQALLVLSVFAVALDVSGQSPTPKYRRVDLGRGMWRVEPVLDASVVPNPPASSARTSDSDVEVARLLLAEARKSALGGQSARARQLIEWASTLNVNWETEPTTPAELINEFQITGLRLQPPGSSSGSVNFQADALFGPESRRPEFGIHVQGLSPQNISNVLRTPTDPATRQGDAASGNTKVGSIEQTAFESPGAPWTAGTIEQSTVGNSAVPSADVRGQPPLILEAELSGRNAARPVAGGGATRSAETRGFWRALAISAICGLIVMVWFAFLMLRRELLQQRNILQGMSETTVQRRDPASGCPTVHSALVPAAGLDSTSGGSDPSIGWTEIDTFGDQKKRSDDRRREQDSELMRQLISNNISIRKQVSDKRTAAA